MGLCVLRLYRALAQTATPVAPPASGARPYGLYDRPRLCDADMTGRPHDVAHAWFRRRLPVPCWAMAHVLGREALSWYRLEQGLGRFRLVGTTVKPPEPCPQDLVADEKQSGLKGERVYSATTAAHACSLGASVAPSASQADLEKASGVFASEAQVVDADEAPETVKTAGWQATQGAWKALFPQSTVSGVVSMRVSTSVLGPPQRWATRLLRSKSGCGRRITPRAHALFPSVCGA